MDPAKEQFIEKMGLLVEADGAPRISGRILGFLLLTPGECSLDDIADILQVSKGSVSTNARLLEGWGAVERTSRPGDRRDYYRIAPNMRGRMLERKLERMRQLRDLIDEGKKTIEMEDEEVRTRFEGLHHMHAHIVERIEQDIQRMRCCPGAAAPFPEPDRT